MLLQVRNLLLLAASFGVVCSMYGAAMAQVGCVPNPNNNGPPFVDGCPLTAAGLNKAFAITVYLNAQNYGVVADGVTSNDVALSNAVNACSAIGGRLFLPPGKILLTGAGSTTIHLNNCALEGAGVGAGGPDLGINAGFGTTIELISTTITPFQIGSNWSLFGVNFFWPNQTTGSSVYPCLFSDDGTHNANNVWIDHITVVNAYNGFCQNAGVDWVTWQVSNSQFYAVNDVFQISNTGDSWRLVNIHFTPQMWEGIVGSAAYAAINVADQVNSMFHLKAVGTLAEGVTVIISTSSAFAWRYLFKVDANGKLVNSKIDGAWDGVATVLDTSPANACAVQTIFTGGVSNSSIPVISGGGITQSGNAASFNLGATACGAPVDIDGFYNGVSNGSFVVSAGQPVTVNNSFTSIGAINDGADYYGVHTTTVSTSQYLFVGNSTFINGAAGNAHQHGIKVDSVLPQPLIITNNIFSGLNDAANLALTGVGSEFTGNNITGTFGTTAVLTSGSGAMAYQNNFADKPPTPTATSCGTGASVTGSPQAGFIRVGSTTPTTACTFTLPFLIPNSSCLFFPGIAVIVSGGPSGAAWSLSMSADIHGGSIQYICLSGF